MPQQQQGLLTPQRFLAVIALLILATVAGTMLRGGAADTSQTVVANPYTAWRICQARVGSALKAPSTAAFPGYDEHAVRASGDLYTITSYVDSDNALGARLRTPFTCRAQWTGKDWTVLGVDF